MEIDRIHFYVEDAIAQRDWFVCYLGFEAIASFSDIHTRTEVVKSGSICFCLSSPLCAESPVAEYFQRHPAGVVDVTFAVNNLEAVLQKATAAGAKVLQPLQEKKSTEGRMQWAKIGGWGELSHTLIERNGETGELYPVGDGEKPAEFITYNTNNKNTDSFYFKIDHLVLNVKRGDLEPALSWYEKTLGFQRQQTFDIQTERSGLHSQVMVHPEGGVQLPINEPTSDNSQIQEFLDANRGSGIQHIALGTQDILATVAQLRKRGLSFIEVPPKYYVNVRKRLGFSEVSAEWEAIAAQQILVDWHAEAPESLLLQTFTQPIFKEPTLFFEAIERRLAAQGFGEGNFRALFEAVEREQIKRETVDG